MTRLWQSARGQWFTIVWMAIEVAVAVIAAIRAHSVALAAFGGDSAIELLSAAIVLARFHPTRSISDKLASKFTGWLLVLLAIYIVADSLYTLIGAESKPKPSYLGIGLLFAAEVVMPWLARRKRSLALATNSSALRADAAQSSICSYLSWIALGGLLSTRLLLVSRSSLLAINSLGAQHREPLKVTRVVGSPSVVIMHGTQVVLEDRGADGSA